MYEPQVDDYVIWERPNGDIDEGWVYFKGDVVDNEKRKKQSFIPNFGTWINHKGWREWEGSPRVVLKFSTKQEK